MIFHLDFTLPAAYQLKQAYLARAFSHGEPFCFLSRIYNIKVNLLRFAPPFYQHHVTPLAHIVFHINLMVNLHLRA